MMRTFATHEIRQQKELSGLWNFRPLDSVPSAVQTSAYVPGCWECLPGLGDYRGRAIYERTVDGGGNMRLLFGGVSHTAHICLDDKELGTHYNAYTPFAKTAYGMPVGRHTLSVEVDNRFSEASALHVSNDYRTYGGITRPVVLEIVPDVYIDWMHCSTAMQGGGWNAKIELCLKNIGDASSSIDLECFLDGKLLLQWTATVKEKSDAVLSRECLVDDVEPYSPENPRLYKLQIILRRDGIATDDIIDRIGFREVMFKNGRLIWNNEPLPIRGFNRHEQFAQFGCAVPIEAMAADIAIIKDLGANAIRTCHYPNDERFLDLCDEAGIIVWEEAHARGLEEAQMQNPNFDRQSEDCIREMIQWHFNHPSIFIWGLLNECASHTAYGRECYQKQFPLVRSLDSSRPVTSASNRPWPHWFDGKSETNGDLCLDLPDVVSYNIYPGWYHNSSSKEYIQMLIAGIQSSLGKGKPVIISEIGAGGIYGFRSTEKDKWSEERQAEIVEQQLTAIFERDDVAGVFIWQFCDCRVDEEFFYYRPKCMNNKGVLDVHRRPKLVYNVVKRAFHEAMGKYSKKGQKSKSVLSANGTLPF